MRVSTETFWLPKAGNTLEEYEDAFWPQEAQTIDEAGVVRCAIADGASEAIFSGLWANLLVQAYGERASHLNRFYKALPRLRQIWRETVSAKPLPWYAEEKVRQGAFAALLGLTLKPSADESELSWQAMAIGDCCLFQMRNGRCRTAFPLDRAEQFNNSPWLLGSNARSNERLADHIVMLTGTCQPGDCFYLATDALACAFLRTLETEGENASDPFAMLRTPEAFVEYVQTQRTQRDENGRTYLRNDDVTLLRVEIPGPETPAQLIEIATQEEEHVANTDEALPQLPDV